MKMIKTIVLFFSITLIVSCATNREPRKAVPIISNPSISSEQAIAICEPRAEQAGLEARSSWQPSSITCIKSSSLINCREGASGVQSGIRKSMQKGNLYTNARINTLKSCLAEYGWKMNRY